MDKTKHNEVFTLEKLEEFLRKEDEYSRALQHARNSAKPIPKDEAIAFVEEALTRPDDIMVQIALADASASVIISVKELKLMKKAVVDGTYEKFRKEPYFIDWMWMYN